MSELDQKIDIFLERNRDDIVRHIKRLVNIRSVDGSAKEGAPFGVECAAVLQEAIMIAEEIGFETRNYEQYCAAVMSGPQQEHIGLFTHLDVVPEGGNWQYKPFDAVEENGYLIGRGTNDDKGPAIAALYAMLCIRELGIPLRHGLRLVFGCNEESGMADMAHYKASESNLPIASIIPDALFPVCCAEKGILSFQVESQPLSESIHKLQGGVASNMVPDHAECSVRVTGHNNAAEILRLGGLSVETEGDTLVVTVTGVSSHAAEPEGSSNAIYTLCRILAGSEVLSKQDTTVFSEIAGFLSDHYGAGISASCEDIVSGKLTHICGLIEKTNRNTALLDFNVRFPATSDPAEILNRIRRHMTEHEFSVIGSTVSPPLYMDPANLIVQKLTAIYNYVAQDDAQPYAVGCATYARHLPNAVAFGPHFPNRTRLFGGQRGQEHMPDENVPIRDLLDSIKIYVFSLIALDEMF